jgi:hypothetical protein
MTMMMTPKKTLLLMVPFCWNYVHRRHEWTVARWWWHLSLSQLHHHHQQQQR